MGNNFGTIKTSYAYGNIKCDKQFGAFVGNNEGEIENCYGRTCPGVKTFVGNGVVSNSNILFSSAEEMKAFDYSKTFLSKYWKLSLGELPTLIPNQY